MTVPRDWLKVSLHHPPLAAEGVGALLFEHGARAGWEDLPDGRGRLVTRAGFPLEDRAALEEALPEMVRRLAEAFELDPADFEWFLETEADHDWAEKWKEGLEPVTVNSRLAVAPTWWPEESLPRADFVLRLDPGLAFGSGHHASTRLALEFLTEMAPAARRILDLGSGSGILSLAAAVLSPEAEILGVDNDPDTLAVAGENAALNGLARRTAFAAETGNSPFDLIAANITLGVLVELAPLAARLAAPGAGLILAGLLNTQVEEAAGVYRALGWNLVRRRDREEWSGLAFRRAE